MKKWLVTLSQHFLSPSLKAKQVYLFRNRHQSALHKISKALSAKERQLKTFEVIKEPREYNVKMGNNGIKAL